jgi:hypothetical protein
MKTRIPARHAGRMSGDRRAAFFSYAAGATGIIANLFLIAFYVLQASYPEDGISLGSANDLVGSLGTAFMIPVALALSAWLPDRRLSRITLLVGLPALAVLTVGGPLLVSGVLAFNVQASIMVAAWMILCLWLFLGAAVLAGTAVLELGLLLPWKSWPQVIFFGVGGLLGVVGMLGIPSG